jgi:peptidoglycan/LPS O-acetylase OafA/YrhL
MKYIKSIDCFRGFAALIVAGIHFDYAFKHNFFSINSFLAVHSFFVISGYVIFINYFDKISNFASVKNFLSKRFLRIYPLHFFTLILFLFLEILKLIALKFFDVKPNYDPFIKNDLVSFFSNIFLLNNIIGNPLSYNGPSWSIAAEFFSYIIFVLFIFFFKKKINIIILLFLLLYYPLYLEHYNSYWGIYSSLNCLFCFSIGGLFGIMYLRNKIIFYNKEIIIVIFFNLYLIYLKFYLVVLLFIFAILLYATSFLNYKSFFSKLLFNSFFTFIGKISYSIYMLHSLIFWVIINFLKVVIHIPFSNNDNQIPSKILLNTEQSYLLLLFLYLFTITISYFSYKFVELKFYKNKLYFGNH